MKESTERAPEEDRRRRANEIDRTEKTTVKLRTEIDPTKERRKKADGKSPCEMAHGIGPRGTEQGTRHCARTRRKSSSAKMRGKNLAKEGKEKASAKGITE